MWRIGVALLGLEGKINIFISSKYNVLRRRTMKHHYGDEMSLEMTEWLELVLPIYCVRINFEYHR